MLSRPRSIRIPRRMGNLRNASAASRFQRANGLEGKARRAAVGVLAAGLTLLCGGCPDVRNGLLDAGERAAVVAATQGLGNDPAEVLQSGVTSTLIQIFFDRLHKPQP